ncbi:MAG: hypothetical protein JWQ04_1365 [Pedosphaera sp.]|nr:hypothetical protein [Pedosphaera sp.]
MSRFISKPNNTSETRLPPIKPSKALRDSDWRGVTKKLTM